jgi:hypothetical protein
MRFDEHCHVGSGYTSATLQHQWPRGGDQLFRVPGWDQSPGVGNAVRAALPTIRREEGTPVRAHDEVLSRAEPHPNIDTCP